MPLRRRRVAPITASTVSDSSASRGTNIRCVFERRSGGLIKNPSPIVSERSFGIMPSSTSLSLNFRRTHRPSVRGRLVKVLRVSDSESPNSPDEIDALDIAQINCDHIPGRIQKLEFALADVIGGCDIAVD